MNGSSIGDIATALYEHVVAVFADAGVTLPDRQIVQAGAAAYDCPLLVVQFLGIVPGTPGQVQVGPQFCMPRRSGEFAVGVLRYVPTVNDQGRPPLADAITAAHAAILTDAGLVAHAAETFIPPVEGYPLLVGRTSPIPEQGGLAGCVVTVTVEVP